MSIADALAGMERARLELDAAVQRERAAGKSWSEIASELGIRKQSAYERFRHVEA